MPDFLGEENLGFERSRGGRTPIAPAGEFMVFYDGEEVLRVKDQNVFQFRVSSSKGGTIVINGDAEAFAAEQKPENAEFPILEAIDVRMGLIVKIE
jgi:hypothetical protein